ncbi:RhoGEF Scd1 [Schizosaccharomyces cryophilus OY26]|uniref:RhoGEF Scd1 n=1 Tax=Schizosaccharomyces cryophilus (strain OY26 / ATCC MYA-4695 / CBS 11777 / NBRC 106824 / NRRL Y48691) TaxID=653667 RepID=S9W2N8_SCHCR|nr:RhoGEF Scd1 [Schizosaccharomyces cryophilus OY26]EPY52749.1 RhoGEF Scd1 [Schizosaccharomyces cryophilus OY26]
MPTRQSRKVSSKSLPTYVNSSTTSLVNKDDTSISEYMKLRLLQPPSKVINTLENTVSLYRRCENIRKRLLQIPGLQNILEFIHSVADVTPFKILHINGIPYDDPVTELWLFCRFGYPLCALYNAVSPEQPVNVNYSVTLENTNACKAELYRFLLMCKKNLGFGDNVLFSISEIFSDSTSSLIKALWTVETLLDKFENLPTNPPGRLLETPKEKSPGMLHYLIESGQRVLAEIYETELKYIQDLEFLSVFMTALQQRKVLSLETILKIFTNLNEILDFQRRFLVGLEMNLSLPPQEQRIGALFLALEERFSVYQVFCLNYPTAQQLIIDNQAQLSELSYLLEPSYEFPALLIKPIQRICKYPLLLSQLIKNTPLNYPHEEELRQGMACVVRIANKVNETRRIHENKTAIDELEQRVIDWKGYSLNFFGQLLLWDVVSVSKADIEREYYVYLFEKILLCCKELSPLKKQARSISINKKPKRLDTLQLKGRILVSNVIAVVPNTNADPYALHIFWRGDPHNESFVLKLRNEESQRLWLSTLSRLIKKTDSSSKDVRNTSSTSLGHHGLDNTGSIKIGSPSKPYLMRTHSLDDTMTQTLNFSAPLSNPSPFSKNGYSRGNQRASPDKLGYPDLRLNGEDLGRSVSRNSQTASEFVGNDSSSTVSNPSGASQTSHLSQVNSLLSDYNYSRSNISRQHSQVDDSESGIYEDMPDFSKIQQSDHSSNRLSYNDTYKYDSGSVPHRGESDTLDAASLVRSDPVMVRLQLHEASFVLVVPRNISYGELLGKVEHKIKLSGIMKDDGSFRVRLKYIDEDGDFITITSDEDVLMAFETCTYEILDPKQNKGMITTTLHVVYY